VIGGKAIAASSDWSLNPSAPSATLSALGAALKAAAQTPKFFRSVSQWNAVYLRYAVVATSLEQLTWSAVVAHVDVVMRIAEEARMKGDTPFVAVLYDDLLRRSFANRAEKRDPQLDIEAQSAKVNAEILILAKSRLLQVLGAVGLGDCGVPSSGASPAVTVGTESVLAKQAAAAEALTRKAESAVRQMQKQQIQLDSRQAALESHGHPSAPNESGPNKRQRKMQTWMDNGRPQKGKGKGKGKY
jgi:hypothetical protein